MRRWRSWSRRVFTSGVHCMLRRPKGRADGPRPPLLRVTCRVSWARASSSLRRPLPHAASRPGRKGQGARAGRVRTGRSRRRHAARHDGARAASQTQKPTLRLRCTGLRALPGAWDVTAFPLKDSSTNFTVRVKFFLFLCKVSSRLRHPGLRWKHNEVSTVDQGDGVGGGQHSRW